MLQLHIDKEAAVALRLYRNASAVDDGRAAGRPRRAPFSQIGSNQTRFIFLKMYSIQAAASYVTCTIHMHTRLTSAFIRLYVREYQGVPTIND